MFPQVIDRFYSQQLLGGNTKAMGWASKRKMKWELTVFKDVSASYFPTLLQST